MNRSELCSILKVEKESLKKIEKYKCLDQRLNRIGFSLVRKEKVGRNNRYILAKIKHYDSIEYIFNKLAIKNKEKDKFIKYIKLRSKSINGDMRLLSSNDFAEIIGSSVYLIRKFDNMLVQIGFIKNEGCKFFKITEGNTIEINEEEHNSNKFKGYCYRKIGSNLDLNIDKDEYENLKMTIRQDFSNYIVPLVKKNKCYMCCSKHDLIVHHDTPFLIQLENTFRILNLYSNDILTDEDIDMVRIYMLGSQLRNKNTTLCGDCHKIVHENMDYLDDAGETYKKVKWYTKGEKYDDLIKLITTI